MKYIVLSLLLVSFCSGILPAKAEIPDDVSQPSLFFTQEEMEKIYKANDGLVSAGDAGSDNSTGEPAPPVDPGPRILKLTGILYRGNNDWVIWFNGTRVMPGKLPDRMLDVMVREDRVAIKWLDRGTNRIINLVLRPHQEYHIDTDTITLGTER